MIRIYDSPLDGELLYTEVRHCIKENADGMIVPSFPTREQIESLVSDPELDTDNFMICSGGHYRAGVWGCSPLLHYTTKVVNYIFAIPPGPAKIMFKKI